MSSLPPEFQDQRILSLVDRLLAAAEAAEFDLFRSAIPSAPFYVEPSKPIGVDYDDSE